MNAVITVVGHDKVGIIAKVSTLFDVVCWLTYCKFYFNRIA